MWPALPADASLCQLLSGDLANAAAPHVGDYHPDHRQSQLLTVAAALAVSSQALMGYLVLTAVAANQPLHTARCSAAAAVAAAACLLLHMGFHALQQYKHSLDFAAPANK